MFSRGKSQFSHELLNQTLSDVHSTFNTHPQRPKVFPSNELQTTALTCTHEGPKTHHLYTGPLLTDNSSCLLRWPYHQACSAHWHKARRLSSSLRECVCWWLAMELTTDCAETLNPYLTNCLTPGVQADRKNFKKNCLSDSV